MNERIRLLAEQATIVTENFYDSEHGYYTHREFDKEKFAELIVRECALTAGIMEYEGRAGIGAQLLDNYGVVE